MNLKSLILTICLVPAVVFSWSCASHQHAGTPAHPSTDTVEGWRLGCQAYSFNRFSFFEAVDKTASLGLHWIEAYPGQRLSPEMPDEKFSHDMPRSMRSMVKQKLAESGVRLAGYGVVRFGNDNRECTKVFEFARDMGIDTITAEPRPEAMDLVEKLCEEYGIRVAIHNHPEPSGYWHPEKVAQACGGRSRLIGACADTGHWMRSGVKPTEALRMLEGRVISLHLKDLNEFGRKDAHDVVWGGGRADIHGILAELNRQDFSGLISIEYEHNWLDSLGEIRRCVEYFNNAGLQFEPDGWRNLLGPGLAGCIFEPGSWSFEDGVLARQGGGDIWTEEQYGDFVLDLEFMVAEKSNSGVFLRTSDIDNMVQTGIEVQVYDSYGQEQVDRHSCGAIYDCLAPSRNMARRPGKWNKCTITCAANKIYVTMNGRRVIDMDLNRWAQASLNPDGTKNKYKEPFRDRPRFGHIGFQDHGKAVWYRNIRIKPL